MNKTIFKNPSEKTKHLEAIITSFYDAVQACNNCNSCHKDCSLNWNFSVCSHGCFLIDIDSTTIDNLLLCMEYHGLEFEEGISLNLNKDNNSFEKILIKIESSSIETECFACPTIINFTDSDNNDEYYFRLRHGYWRVENTTTDEIVATGSTGSFDGICSWDEAKELMAEENLIIEEE